MREAASNPSSGIKPPSASPDSPRVKRYHSTRRILSLSGYLLDLALLLVLLFTGWSIALENYAESFSRSPEAALLIYLAMLGLILKAVSLPLDFANGFWLEHRYGLSNLTAAGWIKDQLKELAVAGALGAVVLEFVYWTMRAWPGRWWIVGGGALTAFTVLLTNLAPVVIFPLFFKFEPLENPALTERLRALCQRAGTRVRGVFQWKLSEKTRKANAALIGLGNTRRIILADTLLEHFSDEEVEAVLAHELGHHVRGHVWQGLVVQAAATFLGLCLVNLVLLRFTPIFGFRGLADFANLPLIVLVAAALSLLLLPAVNAHSRRMEREADGYALRAIPQKSAFISSMLKLAELNLAERKPSAWIEFVFYSHPSIEKRIAFAQRW